MAKLDFIYQEVAKRMVDRLDYIKLQPQMILDIGSGLSIDSRLLKTRFPKAELVQLDIALEVLKLYRIKANPLKRLFGSTTFATCANALDLPLQSSIADIIWSNLCLPYIDNFEVYFKEIYRVLNVGGYFLVSGFGVDSLYELREIGLRTFNFPDMHVIGDILVKLGFSHPVTDVEHITLEYDNFQDLIADIRILGCGNAITGMGVFNKSQYLELENKFKKFTQNGKIKVMLEIYYAHAWKDKTQLNLEGDKKVLQFFPTLVKSKK